MSTFSILAVGRLLWETLYIKRGNCSYGRGLFSRTGYLFCLFQVWNNTLHKKIRHYSNPWHMGGGGFVEDFNFSKHRRNSVGVRKRSPFHFRSPASLSSGYTGFLKIFKIYSGMILLQENIDLKGQSPIKLTPVWKSLVTFFRKCPYT